MSSEAINSTTTTTKISIEEQVFTIEGKDYKRSELNLKTFNSIVIEQDLQSNKVKLTLELEKVVSSSTHYDGVIAKELGIDLKKDAPKADANASK